MLTLCVPTKNRAAFVARLLRYYAAVPDAPALLIGDSSDPEPAGQVQEAVRRASVSGRLSVQYRACPGLSSCAALEALSRDVTTPYCAFLGDDDFLSPRTLARCVEFLETHPDYSAAHGQAVIFQVEGQGVHGPIGTITAYPQAVTEAPTAAARLREFFAQGPKTLLYSVHRAGVWRAMFSGVSALPGTNNSNVFKDEMIPVCVSLIHGKVAEVPGLSLIHQTHASYRFPHVYDWLTSPVWHPSYEAFRDRISQELQRQDRLSSDEAQGVVREVLWGHLVRLVASARRKELGPGWQPRPVWQQRLRGIPVVRAVVRQVREAGQRLANPLSLPSLLDPSSRYGGDFKPVYDAVTSPSS